MFVFFKFLCFFYQDRHSAKNHFRVRKNGSNLIKKRSDQKIRYARVVSIHGQADFFSYREYIHFKMHELRIFNLLSTNCLIEALLYNLH
jgi:hypothetical protein